MSERVVHSAAHLLLSITTTVRPPFLLQLPAVQTMYTATTQGSCQGLTIEVVLHSYFSFLVGMVGGGGSCQELILEVVLHSYCSFLVGMVGRRVVLPRTHHRGSDALFFFISCWGRGVYLIIPFQLACQGKASSGIVARLKT